MSSRFSFVPVDEGPPSPAADTIGALLAANRAWVAPFLILLDGLNFRSVPSMTSGAVLFESATRHDGDSQRLLAAVDELYQEVRDGFQLTHVYGDMLEQYVWHVLAERFPDRLAHCQLLRDGESDASYLLDAATSSGAPAVGVEAKTSERALVGKKARRLQHAAKAGWVISLREATGDSIAGVFVTWAVEDRFRDALRRMVGETSAKLAVVVAREQITQLPNRLAGLRQRLTAH